MSSIRKKRIAVISPNSWDVDEIRARKKNSHYEFFMVGSQIQRENPGVLRLIFFFLFLDIEKEIQRIVLECKKLQVDGVIGTDDFLSAAISAVVSDRLGLPGVRPKALLACQHKWVSRRLQSECLPEFVPDFERVGFDGSLSQERFNELSHISAFVKPIKGSASLLAMRLRNQNELRRHVRMGWLRRLFFWLLLRPFDQLLERYMGERLGDKRFLVEQAVDGDQCTLEGFVQNGKIQILGIVDSKMCSGSRVSFDRFEYPSRMPQFVQSKMKEAAYKLVRHVGLDHTVFNIEFFYQPETGAIHIIEINPRLSGQFSSLFEKVDGRGSYDVQLALATGEELEWESCRKREYCVAGSFVIRSFQDAWLGRVPSSDEIEKIKSAVPDFRFRLMAQAGRMLSSNFLEDMESFRCGIFSVGAKDWEELYRKAEWVRERLLFELLEGRPRLGGVGRSGDRRRAPQAL